MRTILAPVTLDTDPREVVAEASALASALGAELVLAGIAPLVPPVPVTRDADADPLMLTWQAEEQRVVERLLRERRDELYSQLPEGVRGRGVVTWGPVGPALVDAAREHGAQLIVVPIRREGELAHLVHDHADRHVLHHSDVPVLVVPTG